MADLQSYFDSLIKALKSHKRAYLLLYFLNKEYSVKSNKRNDMTANMKNTLAASAVKKALFAPISLLGLGLASVITPVLAATQISQITIQANDLHICLSQFASQKKIFISIDADLTRGKFCKKLQGEYDIEIGFAKLLQGTNLSVIHDSENKYSLHKKNRAEKENILALTTIISGTRTETDNAKYVGSIGVIEEKDISISSNIVDSLGIIPGVEIGGDNGRAIGSQYTIRGFGYQSENRVIIKQDGVPQSPSLFSNHISSFRTDTDILNRVEVVKGASSVLYGSGAIGGIINMQTKSAEAYLHEGESFGGVLGGRYESNNMHSVRGAIYGKNTDIPVDFVLYKKRAKYGDIDLADGGTDDYETIDNDEEINTTYFNVGIDISDEQRLSFSVFDFDEYLETVWQTLYHYDIDEESPITGSLQQTDYVLDYSYNNNLNDLIDFSIKMFSSEAYYDRGWDDVDAETGEVDTGDYKNKETRKGVNIKNIARFNTSSIKHTLLIGLDYNNREEDAIFLINGVYSDFGSMPNTYDDWGLYIQDIIEIDALELTLGGRFDNFDRRINKENTTDYTDNNFSPRIAAAYEILDGFNLLLGYSETFRAPTPAETSSEGALNPYYYYLANPDLGAETAKEFEGGFSYNSINILFDDDQLSIKSTYFDGKIEDMISFNTLHDLGVPPESETYGQYQNVSDARRKGYEFSAMYQTNNVRFDSSFEHIKLYDEDTGENVNQGFADKVNLTTTYINEQLDLLVGISIDHWFAPDQNPESFVSNGETYTYIDQDFTQLNLKGSWDIPMNGFKILNHAKIKFGINNLTDKKYINARYTNGTSRVGTGKNIYADLEVAF